MANKDNSFVSSPPEFEPSWTEKRKSPRIGCHLMALLIDESGDSSHNQTVIIDNLSSGGLAFSVPREDGPEPPFESSQDISLSIELPEPDGEIEAQGSILRVSTRDHSLHGALKYALLKDRGSYEEFLRRATQEPFFRFFLTNHFGSSLKGHRILRFSPTRRLFERIQRMVADDNYAFQQEIDTVRGSLVQIDGQWKIMMSSYSYLGLLNDPRISASAIEAMGTYGTGSSGVRLLTGTTKLHRGLEKEIAQFKNTESAVAYSSGYLANQAVIYSLFDKRDTIIADYLAHQSIFDACKLTGAEVVKFKHNDMSDLERKLDNAPSARRKLIVTDAVFSMDGDIAPARDIVKLAKAYGALTMVDEAHAIGVIGRTGRGIDEHFDLSPGDIDIYMGTLSKAIPSCGGYIAGKSDLIYYLKHASHPFIFSAALSPTETAAATKALEIIREEPWRIAKIRENINYFSEGLRQMGYQVMHAESAIISLLIGDDYTTYQLSMMMNHRDVFVCPVVFPAVPKNASRIRNCLMASHTKDQLDHVLNAYAETGKALHLI